MTAADFRYAIELSFRKVHVSMGSLEVNSAEPHQLEKKPTLLVLSSTYPRWAGDHEPGFVHELCRRLTAYFEVSVICPHARGSASQEILDGVRIVRYRYAPTCLETLVNDGGIVSNLRKYKWKWILVPSFLFAQAITMLCWFKINKPDVVHAHWLIPQGLIAALVFSLNRSNIPLIVTSHGADLFALKGVFAARLRRVVFRRTEKVTVVSSSMRDFSSRAGLDAEKIAVMPMGVDLKTMFFPDSASPRSETQLLFVGRLVEKKGLKFLIEALPLILASRPELSLKIAGFGPEEAYLRGLVAEYKLQHAVQFLGAVPQRNLPALYREAAVFVAPFVEGATGDQEGLGLVVVEAMGCECPVVVGDVPAVYDVVTPGLGLLVRSVETQELARAVLDLLSDRVKSRAMAMRAREHCLEKFDWVQIADSYAHMFTASVLAAQAN